MDGPRLKFESVYEHTQAAALKYITSKCLSICDIDDIYQDTFLNVYRAICNTDKEIENEEAFVISIAKKSLSRYYGLLAKLKAQVSTGLARLPEGPMNEETKDEVDVEMLVLDRALCDEIFETVSTMPIDIQRIVYMYYVLDMPLKMIALTLGMKEESVKNRLYRTLERIRRSYKRREAL